MAQVGGQHVDPFMVADPSELSDWRLPLSFMKPRHGSDSSEGDQNQESWRMKERVRRADLLSMRDKAMSLQH